jgi:hypothetical protein
MNILTTWLRHYLPALSVSDRQLAEDLTLRGIAVEGVHDLGGGNGHLFEMDITTNRVDAMNHYGARRRRFTTCRCCHWIRRSLPRRLARRLFRLQMKRRNCAGGLLLACCAA